MWWNENSRCKGLWCVLTDGLRAQFVLEMPSSWTHRKIVFDRLLRKDVTSLRVVKYWAFILPYLFCVTGLTAMMHVDKVIRLNVLFQTMHFWCFTLFIFTVIYDAMYFFLAIILLISLHRSMEMDPFFLFRDGCSK